jgi:DNA-directed RNA polymerase specialized sigma24 family protein
MAELKEEQREALLLQYVDDLSIAEIAVVMGRSPAAINSLLQRGRASLLRRGKSVLLGEPGQEGNQ